MNTHFKHILTTAITLAMILSSLIPLSPFALKAEALEVPETPHTTSMLVYCVEAGELLGEKNADEICYPTALTKLMTALLVSEWAKKQEDGFSTVCTVSPSAYYSTTGQDMDLFINEQLTVGTLLECLLLAGANDAANVLAEAVAGSIDAFVLMMNQKAKELGMTDTYYANPTGLHEDSMVTTARDQLTLAIYALTDSRITEIAKEKTFIIPQTKRHEKRSVGTRNFLVSERTTEKYYLPIASGLICGETPEGGFCIIGTSSHDGKNYISVLLNCETITYVDQEAVYAVDENGDFVFDEDGNRVELVPRLTHTVYYGFTEAAEILSWADDNYDFIKAVDRHTPICEVKVKLAKNTDRVSLIPESSVEIFVPSDMDRDRDIKIEYVLDKEELKAPVVAGQQVGTVTVYYLGEKLGDIPLVVNTAIEQNTLLVLLSAAWEFCNTPVMRVIIGLTLIGMIVYVVITAHEREKRRKEERKRALRAGSEGAPRLSGGRR